MRTQWYVINEDNQTSWSAKKDAAESFKSKRAAQKRAVELANWNPGQVFFICQTVGFADTEVTPATHKEIF